MADRRRRIELFLFFQRQRKKGGRGVKDGGLQRAGHTMVDDLKEAGADAGGTHTLDDLRRRGGMRVRQERGDVDGRHVEFIGGRAPGGGVPPGPRRREMKELVRAGWDGLWSSGVEPGRPRQRRKPEEDPVVVACRRAYHGQFNFKNTGQAIPCSVSVGVDI